MNASKPTARRRYWIVIVLVFTNSLVVSCIDQVALPFRQERTQLVVEGSITTELPPYTVQLTYSRPFGSSSETVDTEAVANSKISIQDDTGRSTRLVPISNKPGYYQTTDSLFQGVVGRSYTLYIETADHKHYQSSSERIDPVPQIDSLSASLKADVRGFLFSFSVNSRDPATATNYYRWTARAYYVENWLPCGADPKEPYRWIPVINTSINILSDTYINGNTVRRDIIKSPIHSSGPHFVEAKQYSITQQFYQFLKGYNDQQSRNGSIFDPLPGRVVGNLICLDDVTEQVLGYFNASAVSTKQLRYYDTTNLIKPNVYSYIFSYMPDCSTEGVFMLKYNPPGF